MHVDMPVLGFSLGPTSSPDTRELTGNAIFNAINCSVQSRDLPSLHAVPSRFAGLEDTLHTSSTQGESLLKRALPDQGKEKLTLTWITRQSDDLSPMRG